jgi:hypothetical protein
MAAGATPSTNSYISMMLEGTEIKLSVEGFAPAEWCIGSAVEGVLGGPNPVLVVT